MNEFTKTREFIEVVYMIFLLHTDYDADYDVSNAPLVIIHSAHPELILTFRYLITRSQWKATLFDKSA